jgi:uncharacterized peroxidase-related enzyme
MSGIGHLRPAPPSAVLCEQVHGDQERLGFVMNATRLWGHLPEAKESLFDLMAMAAAGASLTFHQQAVLVTATATALGDTYCSLAWGSRLAREAGVEVATDIVCENPHHLDDEDRVLTDWAHRVVTDPNGTSADDVETLRAAGFSDEQIFSLTAYIAFRIAFSTVNDTLGAQPDPELIARAPEELVRSIGL